MGTVQFMLVRLASEGSPDRDLLVPVADVRSVLDADPSVVGGGSRLRLSGRLETLRIWQSPGDVARMVSAAASRGDPVASYEDLVRRPGCAGEVP